MDVYVTTDLPLAATLILYGGKVSEVKKNPRGLGVFVFVKTEPLSSDVTAYWNEKLIVEPMKFADQMRKLKRMIADL